MMKLKETFTIKFTVWASILIFPYFLGLWIASALEYTATWFSFVMDVFIVPALLVSIIIFGWSIHLLIQKKFTVKSVAWIPFILTLMIILSFLLTPPFLNFL